jgi:Excreted virulence factor EspC, type VII ESX diderm
MPFDPFHVDLDGVLGLSRVHANAAETLTSAKESALAKAAGIDATHGSIGTRVSGAFSEVLDARHGALQAAAHTSNELSQRLAKAVSAYSRGDESGAESVRAAAATMADGVSGSSGTPIAAGPSVPSGTIGTAESSGVGDVLGEAGPRDAQVTQAAGQSLPGAGIGADAAHADDLAVAPPAVVPPPRSDDEQAEKLTRD